MNHGSPILLTRPAQPIPDLGVSYDVRIFSNHVKVKVIILWRNIVEWMLILSQINITIMEAGVHYWCLKYWRNDVATSVGMVTQIKGNPSFSCKFTCVISFEYS